MKSNKVDFGRGRGGGQVVSVLAFLSNNPSLIPAEVQNFSVKIVVEKNENKQKEAGDGPFKKLKSILSSKCSCCLSGSCCWWSKGSQRKSSLGLLWVYTWRRPKDFSIFLEPMGEA